MSITKLDDQDHKIINILRKDAKIPIKKIAQITKIRPSTVHQRIQRLISSNIIEHYTLKLNNDAVGEGIICIILISTQKPIPMSAFEETYIREAFTTSGDHDLLIKIKCNNMIMLNDIILDLKNKYPIQSMQTLIATTTIKEEL